MPIEGVSGGQSDSHDDEPKLIIDEDWKTQVQREKEELKKKTQAATDGDLTDSGDSKPEKDPPLKNTDAAELKGKKTEAGELDADSSGDAIPPASFEFLISGMATQALAAMGQIPDEDGNPYPANLDYARHYIDLLGVVELKTKGNLSDHENRFLQDALHQLRMLFITVKQG